MSFLALGWGGGGGGDTAQVVGDTGSRVVLSLTNSAAREQNGHRTSLMLS